MKRAGLAILGGALVLMLGSSSRALGEDEGKRWAILLTGISGDPDLQKEFLKWSLDLRETLLGPLKFPKDQVFVLFDDPTLDAAAIQFKSTRESLENVIRLVSQRASKQDLVFVFVAGHGSSDTKGYKLNLPGPDPTGEDLASLLYSIPAARFIVANMTTCSGASIPALSGKGKVIVSATKSGHEKNQTQMGRFFVSAFKDGAADLDKNGRVSVLEAFNYASQKVEDHYKKEGNLQTEHPVLEDSGDGKAQPQPGPENGEGLVARTTFLDAGSALFSQQLSPEDKSLALEAQEVEKQVEALRYQKAQLPAAEYEQKLEALLLRLAQINAKLRKK